MRCGSAPAAARPTTCSSCRAARKAKSYVKQLDVKTGVLHTKGNAIVYGHQIGTGPAVSEDEVKEVEKCLA